LGTTVILMAMGYYRVTTGVLQWYYWVTTEYWGTTVVLLGYYWVITGVLQ